MAKEALRDKAYAYLYESIINYNYLPGDVIIEQCVSDELKISRTPVREALKVLEQEGLVIHVPARGTFVKDISAHDIEEIMELRILFETYALKSAIKILSDSDLDRIKSNFASITNYSSDEDYYNADRILHTSIIKCIRNTRMITFHTMIETQLERFRRISSKTPDRLSKSYSEHLSIIEAIRSHDLEKAEIVLVKHLNNVKESTLNVYHSMRVEIQIQ